MQYLRNEAVTVPEETSAESRLPTVSTSLPGPGSKRIQTWKVLIAVLTVLLLGTFLTGLRRRTSPHLADKASLSNSRAGGQHVAA